MKLKIKSSKGFYELEILNNMNTNILNYLSKNNCLVLVDQNVFKKNKKIKSQLKKFKLIKINPSEKIKEYSYLKNIIDKILNFKFKRHNFLVAIGGGIVQDITSFIASVLFRGVKWIFFPTTLEAQGDSCIGSKTSINFKNKKNQIGTFYPPKKIYISNNLLDTLPKEHIYSGIGEMLHYFVFSKKDLIFFLKNLDSALSLNSNLLNEYIFRSLKIKKKVIERDEFDLNVRNLFNFGHTFGHALETYFKFKLPHGKCVAIGIDIANYVSYRIGKLNKDKRNILQKSIIKIVPELNNLKKVNVEKFIKYLRNDKKSETGYHNIILMYDFGKIKKFRQKDNKFFKKILQDYFDKKIYLKQII